MTVHRDPGCGLKKISDRRRVDYFSTELNALRRQGLLRTLSCIESRHGSRITINEKEYLNFSSNDYLNLSGHREIIKASIIALYRNGAGSGSSRALSGTFRPHAELEQLIAKFKKTQAALVFNSGYAANTGIMPVVAGEGSVIFSDELNHASIIDGARLSRAKIEIFRHRDMSHLEELLQKYSRSRSVSRKLVITDTVFSMDGDIAPLKDIDRLCRKYDALFMIDDAHATGVIGESGRGGLEHFGIRPGNIIQMGTLGKAAGCFGAFAAGKKSLINILINRARSFLYSTALPPPVAAASAMSLHIIATSSSRLRKRLWTNRERLYRGLADLGFDTLGSETPILPVLTGSVENTIRLSRYLYRNNIFAPAIRPPTVQEDRCRIRFSVTAAQSSDDIDTLLECLRKYRKKSQSTSTKKQTNRK